MRGMYHNSDDENESRGVTSVTKKIKMCLRKSCGN